MRTISQKQFNELNDYLDYDGADEEFVTELQHLTGITAHPYTAYNLYDENGNFLCNSEDIDDLKNILNNAGVGIRKE